MFTVDLDQDEQKVIKDITLMQLENLRSIIDEYNCEVDVTMYCLESDLNKKQLQDRVNTNIYIWENIHINPDQFLQLPQEELKIFTHILTHQNPKQDAHLRIFRALVINSEFESVILN